ncbi:MAG: response regulator transcription factor [Flavobacteriales bacterium]|nr:response regulator transcription factor [Flavobacteriales bacterium]
MQKINLIIADSSELFQFGIKHILLNVPEIEIIGIANSNEELVDLCERLHPDIILFDYHAKNFTIDVIESVKFHHRKVKFVGITGEKTGGAVLKGVRHGIKSYVKKECSAGEIIDAIKETAKGNQFFCGDLMEQMRNENVDVNNIEKEALSCEPVSLSDRELEIIKMIAEGYTNAQIAALLYISNHTVNTHRKNIMKKLGINNTAGIVMLAVKSGLVTPDNYVGLPEFSNK